jgi:predicted acyltransferase
MFISGAAMVFSYEKRWGRGETWRATFYHVLTRASLLFLIGWAVFHISSAEGASKGDLFIHIFPQLAFAGFVSFMLLRKSVVIQLGAGIGILAITEIFYRLWPVAGFDEPFTAGKNFGAYLDLALFGELSRQNGVALSIVPSAVYTILGVVAAGILRNEISQAKKLWRLAATGGCGVGLGLALSTVTPIVSGLNTSSFVVLTGGLAFLSLALGFWLADVRGLRKRSLVFLVPGLNPLFIFIFALTGGTAWFRNVASPFTMSFTDWIGAWGAQVLTSLVVWGMMWALCYWLYRRKLFIKI